MKESVRAEAGVVDQHLDVTRVRRQRGYDALTIFIAREIGGECGAVPAVLRHAHPQIVQTISAPSDGENMVATLGEQHGQLGADSARRASDNGDLSRVHAA